MEPDNKFYVYLHTFADGSVYVGKGSSSRAYRFGDGQRGQVWLRAKNKYGKPSVSFAASDVTEELAFFIEQEMIISYRHAGVKLRNISDGGIGGASGLSGPRSANYGKVRSQLSKDNHRIRMTGDGNPRYGQALSDETKRKISEARIGTANYTFVHDDGSKYHGARYDFQLEYGINTKHLFCRSSREKYRGWRVSPSQSSMN